jgi:hypothetical protein
MNRPNRIWGVALALLCMQDAAVADVNTEAAQGLARKSGLWTQLESLGAQVGEGMSAAAAKNPGKLSAEQRNQLTNCVQSAYAVDRLRATAVDAIAGALQPADLAPLQAWYDSSIGRKVATVEQASSTQSTDPQERLRRGAQALASASDARKAALQAIVTQSHSVEMMTDTVIEMALAVQQGMTSIDPAAPGGSTAQLRANLMSRRPQIMTHYAQISINAYAFTYLGLADEELQRYADFLGSPAGTAFNDGSMHGVSRALNSGAVQLGRCIQAGRPTKGT